MKSTPDFVSLENHWDFARRQVCREHSDFKRQCEVEYAAVNGFIGQPARILDLGCGLGRMSIYLNWQLDNPPVHFVLADANEVTNEENISGWDPGRDFYNKMENTQTFCNDNGLQNLSLFDINRDAVSDIGQVDLLFSFLAVGFHFPLEESLRKYWSCLKSDSTLIFGIRHHRYAIADFSEYFEECYVIESLFCDFQKQTSKQHFLVLKGPRSSEPPAGKLHRHKGGVLKRWLKKL